MARVSLNDLEKYQNASKEIWLKNLIKKRSLEKFKRQFTKNSVKK